MVSFQYLSRGIKVRGEWYPILKMQWLEGDTLDVFVERNRADSAVMCDLTRQFLEMTIDLAESRIAHGDLQHGNILIADGQIRLIDYDGMYVPGLEGLPSEEIGHPNYQDPRRSGADFGPRLDNFSAWVIFLSLLALSVSPGLWDVLSAGEECLLFRQEDFKSPESSSAFQALDSVQDDVLNRFLGSFRNHMASPRKQVPALEADWADLISPRAAPATGDIDWLSDHLASGKAGRSIRGIAPSVPSGSAWVLDHMEKPSPVRFAGPLTRDRVVLFACSLASILIPILAYSVGAQAAGAEAALGAALGAPLLVVGVLRLLYRTLPEVEQKRHLASAVGKLKKRQRQLDADLDRLSDERKSLAREEAQALADMSRRKEKLYRSETQELSKALSSFQKRFVDRQLGRIGVIQAQIRGIGPKLTSRLVHAGYRTAKDIDWRVTRVHGIGEGRKSDLMAWRRHHETAIRQRVPSTLPRDEKRKIESNYRRLRDAVEAEKVKTKSDYTKKQSRVDIEESRKRAQLSELKLDLERTKRELESYDEITFPNYLRSLIPPLSAGGAP
jgi:hypothetical protein